MLGLLEKGLDALSPPRFDNFIDVVCTNAPRDLLKAKNVNNH